MSRAFVSENDGWAHCIAKNRDCLFAERDGQCMLSKCKMKEKTPEKKTT